MSFKDRIHRYTGTLLLASQTTNSWYCVRVWGSMDRASTNIHVTTPYNPNPEITPMTTDTTKPGHQDREDRI